MNVQFCFQSTKSPHFPLRGKVGQLRKRKRVLYWPIYATVYTVLVYAIQYSIIIYLGKTAHSWSLCLGSSAQAAEHSGKLQEGHQYSPCTWV